MTVPAKVTWDQIPQGGVATPDGNTFLIKSDQPNGALNLSTGASVTVAATDQFISLPGARLVLG